MKIYIMAFGGFSDITAKAFPTYEAAYESMREEYEGIMDAWTLAPDEEGCFIESNHAEICPCSIDSKNAWGAKIIEQDIEINEPKEEWVYTFHDPRYGEDEMSIFSSEKEAIDYMIEAVQKEADFDDFEEFKAAIQAISEAVENESYETGDDYADELADKFCMGYGGEYEGEFCADDHYVCLPETKYGGRYQWAISQSSTFKRP